MAEWGELSEEALMAPLFNEDENTNTGENDGEHNTDGGTENNQESGQDGSTENQSGESGDLGDNQTDQESGVDGNGESGNDQEDPDNLEKDETSFSLEFNGQEIPVGSIEELRILAQEGLINKLKGKGDKKKQALVSGIDEETLVALNDLKSGKKDALKYFMKKFEVDPYQLGENEYNPEQAPVDLVKEYWSEYTNNYPDKAGRVSVVYEEIPEAFKMEVYKPQMFEAFVDSVNTGEFDTVYPIAVKEKALNPALSWVQAYQVGAKKTGQSTKPKGQDGVQKPAGKERKEAPKLDVWNNPEHESDMEEQFKNTKL